jgi:hypothetical protein
MPAKILKFQKTKRQRSEAAKEDIIRAAENSVVWLIILLALTGRFGLPVAQWWISKQLDKILKRHNL